MTFEVCIKITTADVLILDALAWKNVKVVYCLLCINEPNKQVIYTDYRCTFYLTLIGSQKGDLKQVSLFLEICTANSVPIW